MRYTIFVLGNKIPHQFINNSCILLPYFFYFQYHFHSRWVHYIGLDHVQNLCSIQGIQYSEAILDAKIYINRRSKNRGSRGINWFPKFLIIFFACNWNNKIDNFRNDKINVIGTKTRNLYVMFWRYSRNLWY